MANTTSTLLQIVNLEEGVNDNIWGEIADANWLYLENAIANLQAISSTGGTTTLTADQARNAILVFSGTLVSDHTVEVPAHSKWWLVRNTHVLGAYALKMKISGGTALTIPQGNAALNLVWCDGTDLRLVGISEATVDAKVLAATKVFSATVGGTANAITLDTSPAGYARAAGNIIVFPVGSDNTGAVTVNPETLGVVTLYKHSPEGKVALSGGELQAGLTVAILDDGTDFQLLGDPSRLLGTTTDIAAATTTDLGTVFSHVARITGTTTITGFGSSANIAAPIYFIRFAGVLTLTYNAASLIIPGSADVITAAGDFAICEYLGSGNWRVLDYQRATGVPLITPTIPLATKTSGGAVCLQRVVQDVTSVVTLNTAMPVDNTIPQNTEGVEVLSQAITPLSASSYLIIKIYGMISWNAGGAVNAGAFALFQDSVANALFAQTYPTGTTGQVTISREIKLANASTTPRTYKVRAGPPSAGTHYWLGDTAGAALFGGVAKGSLVIEEWLDV